MKTMKFACGRVGLLLLTFGLLLCAEAYATTDLIVRYQPSSDQATQVASGKMSVAQVRAQQMRPLSTSQLNKLSTAAGTSVVDVRSLATGAHILRLQSNLTGQALQDKIKKMQAADPSIKYIVPNRKVRPLSTQSFNAVRQWDMQLQASASPTWFGDNFVGVQNVVAGSPGNGVIVAVVDTGYVPHPNFLSNLVVLPGSSNESYGYQFISDCRTAGSCPASTPDAQANLSPQPNALDLGDFVSSADESSAYFAGCQVQPSDWHGSHVTGTVIAQGDDGTESGQILGGAYGAMVLPVRVLGKCGGFTSDVIEGMLWAVGDTIPGLASNQQNQNKADVINLSLGSSGSCDAATQDAIDLVNANGVIVVVAAGNANTNVSNASPASCQGVISVASRGPTKQLAWYSNFGATTITASGGDDRVAAPSPSSQPRVYSTIWSSLQQFVPTESPSFGYLEGTSQATPHASAAVADIISYLKAHNTTYSVADIIQVLNNTASYNYQNCNGPNMCAASGILDAEAAMNYVINGNLGTLLTPSLNAITIVSPNTPVTVTITNNNPSSVMISNVRFASTPAASQFFISPQSTCAAGTSLASGATCTIMVSALKSATSGAMDTVRVLGGNNGAILASFGVTYNPSAAPVGGGGGGGCSMIKNGHDFGLLILLLLGVCLYSYMRISKILVSDSQSKNTKGNK